MQLAELKVAQEKLDAAQRDLKLREQALEEREKAHAKAVARDKQMLNEEREALNVERERLRAEDYVNRDRDSLNEALQRGKSGAGLVTGGSRKTFTAEGSYGQATEATRAQTQRFAKRLSLEPGSSGRQSSESIGEANGGGEGGGGRRGSLVMFAKDVVVSRFRSGARRGSTLPQTPALTRSTTAPP